MKKRILSLILVLVALFSLVACGGSKEAASTDGAATEAASTDGAAKESAEATIKSSRDTLIVGTSRDPGILDPNEYNNQLIQAVNKQMYETLFARGDDGSLQPVLAESWEYEDDCTVVIKLRQGVKFHNGEEMKASDVLFSLERASTKGSSSPAVAAINFEKSYAVDDYTIKLISDEVYVPMLDYLNWPLTAIYSEKAYNEANGDFTKCAIGTGAYKLEKYVSGDRIEFVAFEDYWGEPAYVKNLIMRIIPEASSRTMELETGGVDIIYEVAATDIARLEENPDTVIYRDESLCPQLLMINTSHEPFDNVLVRKAIAHAIDRQTAMEVAYNGTGVLATGFCSSEVRDFAPDVTPYEYDPELAKQLLAEAGYPDGFSATFHTDTGAERSAITENIANQLAQVGINLEIISLESVAYQSMFPDNLHDLHINGLTCTTGEGDKAFRWFTSTHPSGKNFTFWVNEEYDRLIDEAVKTLDDDARKELYRQAQQLLKDDCILIPLLTKEIISASRSDVKGFKNDISYECPLLKNVYFE